MASIYLGLQTARCLLSTALAVTFHVKYGGTVNRGRDGGQDSELEEEQAEREEAWQVHFTYFFSFLAFFSSSISVGSQEGQKETEIKWSICNQVWKSKICPKKKQQQTDTALCLSIFILHLSISRSHIKHDSIVCKGCIVFLMTSPRNFMCKICGGPL